MLHSIRYCYIMWHPRPSKFIPLFLGSASLIFMYLKPVLCPATFPSRVCPLDSLSLEDQLECHFCPTPLGPTTIHSYFSLLPRNATCKYLLWVRQLHSERASPYAWIIEQGPRDGHKESQAALWGRERQRPFMTSPHRVDALFPITGLIDEWLWKTPFQVGHDGLFL